MSEFVSPVGRLVQGSVLVGNDKNRKGEPYIVKSGANKGQPTKKFYIGVAFPKVWPADPASQEQGRQFGALYAQIMAEGKAGYPNMFNPDGTVKPGMAFASKIIDGDGFDKDGKPNNQKPGFAGHWIVRFENGFAPKLVHQGRYIDDPAYCKTGYYVRVIGDVKANIGSETPGVYMNVNAVELIHFGEVIAGGIDAVGAFAAAGPVAYMPPGASATPIAPASLPALQGMPGLPAQPGAALAPPPGMFPAPQQAGPSGPAMTPVPQQAITPNPGFVAGALGQPPQLPTLTPQLPVVAAGPVYVMTPAAQGFTREQYNAQGHTDAQLIAAGFMVQQ